MEIYNQRGIRYINIDKQIPLRVLAKRNGKGTRGVSRTPELSDDPFKPAMSRLKAAAARGIIM